MALQVWLPLNGDLINKGLANVGFTNSSGVVDNNGKIGKCYSFTTTTGSGIYNSTGMSSADIVSKFINHHSWSLGAWVLTTSSSESPVMHISYGLRLFVGGGTKVSLYNSTRSVSCSANTATNDGKWHHVVATYNVTENIIRIYVDSILKNSVLYNSSETYASSWDNGIYVGKDPNASSAGYYYNGKVNDVRIYDHCLSPKEVKEISKGLVLHYKLDDPYVENTTNIATSLTPQANVGGWGKMTATQISTNNYHLKHKTTSTTDLSYWSTFVYTLPSTYANTTISFSARLKNIRYANLVSNGSTSWLFIGQGNDGQYPTHGSVTKYFTQLEENMIISWTGSLTNSHRYLVIELWNNAASVDGYIEFDLLDIQIEQKDHVTPYTLLPRGIQTKYDKTVYTEADGTHWVRIAHHNNPANGVFPSSSASWSSGVYVDADRWFDVYGTTQQLANFEYMVKQKTTSSASELKYRWIQKKSPLTAVWADVQPSAVTRITTTGYTDGGYGGLYILNSNTHMVIANNSNGNWFGAFGCWTAYSGGIPGYPNNVVTSGYMDLYVRVDEIMNWVYDGSGYGNDGIITGTLTSDSSSARYNKDTKFGGHNCYFLSKNPFYNNIQPCTFAFWFKPNASNASYNTIISNTSPHNGFWISVNTEGSGCWSYNSGTYISGASGTLNNNQWYHLVWQYKGDNQYQWYLNGNAITTTISGTPKAPTFTEYLNVGGCQCSDTATGSNKYDQYGNVSDIRVYSTVLSADDIKELYNTSAYIYNDGTVASLEFIEGGNNIAIDVEKSRILKTFGNGLSSYTQSNCSCTLTDDGYRIYRTPNKTVSGDGNTMWGGFVIDNGESNRFNFQKGHTYMLQFEVKGKTSNAVSSIYWTNWVGWGGGGLSPSPSNEVVANPVTANYNSSDWKTFTYKWTINDDVYKVCTSGYGGRYTTGNTYMSYTGFKYGFDYTDTGSLGTDLYIKNIRMYDITNQTEIYITKSGILNSNDVTEEILPAEMTLGGVVGKEIIEV